MYESPSNEGLFGYAPEVRVGHHALELVHPDDKPGAEQALRELMATEHASVVVELRVRHADGSYRVARASALNLLDHEAVAGIVVHFVDITELKATQAIYREQRNEYEAIIRTSHEGIMVLDAMGLLRFVNPALVRMLGYQEEQLIGRSVMELTREAPPDSNRGELPSFELGRVGRGEVRFRRADDSDCWAIVTSTRRDDDSTTTLCMVTDVTDLKRIQLERARSERRFRGLVEALPDAIFTLDLKGNVVFANSRCRDHFGWSDSELLGRSLTRLFDQRHAGLFPVYVKACSSEGSGKGVEVHTNIEARRRDGTAFPAEVTFSHVMGEAGPNVIAIVRNITRRKQDEGEIRRLATFPMQNPNPVMESDASGDILFANPAAIRLAEHLGREVAGLLPADHLELVKTFLQGSPRGNRIEVQLEDHTVVWTYHPVPDANLVHLYGSDITDRKRAEARLAYDAVHDAGTGLPNRVLFKELLERVIVRARRDDSHAYAVVLLDIDRFKVINESLGHVPGNELLASLAQRLENEVGADATVARLGGDEFAILVDTGGRAQAIAITERVQDALAEPFRVGDDEVYVTASIGIAFGSAQINEPDDVIGDAERAMYRAKSRGRAQYAIADKETERHSRHLLALQTALRKAIDNEDFLLFYQPIVSLETGAIEGFEALLRWRHLERGLIPPSEFIPLAEDTGLILALGSWAIETACRQNLAWQSAGLKPLLASVNLSTRQFQQEDLVGTIRQILDRSGLDPKYLKLEITESTAATNVEAVIATLRQLKDMGIHIVIDDFGTGYSSLSYLQQLPIDLLKIDRTFVKNVVNDDDSAAIVRTIIAMAHNLGIETVAEGVETAQQLNFLYRERSDFIQGYYFSPAVPAANFEQMLRDDRRLEYALYR